MRKLINPNEEWYALFETITRSSWRWGCQSDYPSDHEWMQRWHEGEPLNQESRRWTAYIQGLHQTGIPFERVRMLTEPLSDYLAWMFATTNWNIDAGEDVRWIKESKARELDAPEYDFYIFDDNRVVIMNHDGDKVLTGAEVIDDEDVVAEHQAWREKVWPHAVKHREYLFEVIKRGVDGS